MFRPVPMIHMRVQVPNADATRAARSIADEGLLHLVDIAHGRVAGDAAPPGTRELLAAFRDLSRRLRQVASRLSVAAPEPVGRLESASAADLAAERDRVEAVLNPIEHAADAAWHRHAEAGETVARTKTLLAQARRLASVHLDAARLAGLAFTTVRLGLAEEADLEGLAALLQPAPFAIVPLDEAGPPVLAAVCVPTSGQARLDDALRVVPFETVPLPDAATGWDPEVLGKRLEAAEGEARGAAADLESLRAAHGDTVASLLARADTAVLLLQAQTLFATSGRFTVISGWIPEESAERMRRLLERATGGRAVVDLEAPEHLPEVASGLLKVPILHRNPLLLRPFQRLVRLYGTPSYQELEPTAFFGFTFLVMFGLMFGDVGHGAIIFSAGFLLFRYFPRFLDYGILLMEAAAASIVFGFLYGSFFGIEGLLPVIWMEPLRNLNAFMFIAVGFGVVLVSGGLILGVINAWRRGERATAIFGPHGLLGATLYWVGLLLVVRAMMPGTIILPPWALVALLSVPVALLILRPLLVRRLDGDRRRPGKVGGPLWLKALEGSVEIVDTLFGFLANTVSFVRIAAFAAVHAGIFIALFAVADTLANVPFSGVLKIVVLIIGNAVVIFLEGLTVSVQVLRLEYYEFFSKFFHGGGEAYRPLALRRDDSKGESP